MTSKYDELAPESLDPEPASPETTEQYVARLEVLVDAYAERMLAVEAAAHGLAETLRVMPPSPAMGWAYHMADDLTKQIYAWRKGD